MLHVMFWSKKKSKSVICFWIHPFSCVIYVESMLLLHLCYTLNAIQITRLTSYEHHHVWDEFILYTVHTLWISYGACVFQFFFVCKQVAVFPLGFNSMCTEHWKKIANLFFLANLLFVANLLLLVFSFSLF